MDAFRIIKQIGSGSFGTVILASSKSDEKIYVIKQINLQKLRLEEKYAARREISVLARLNHPNIVTYYSSFEQDDCLNILMDYCNAGDLHSKIEKIKFDTSDLKTPNFFSETQIWDWYLQICLGIKHMHDRRILHRDLKSQNIFLMKNGMVKVGDFGIARILDNTFDMARTCVGTPYYLSPEICENKPYDTKTDIWALGCLLYEMMMLHHPFRATNMKSLMLKIVRASFPPLPSNFSGNLRAIVNQQLKLKPNDRPSIDQILGKSSVRCKLQEILAKYGREHEIEMLYAERSMAPHKKKERTKSKSKSSKKSKKIESEESIELESAKAENEPETEEREYRNKEDTEILPNPEVEKVEEATTSVQEEKQNSEESEKISIQCQTEWDFDQEAEEEQAVSIKEEMPQFEVAICTQQMENVEFCDSKSCKKCGRVMTAHRKQCRKCGNFKMRVHDSCDMMLAEESGIETEISEEMNKNLSLMSTAHRIRTELEESLGLETFSKYYSKLLEEGDWLDPDTISTFEKDPQLCRKFRELLVAECSVLM